MLDHALSVLMNGRDLSCRQTEAALNTIMDGNATPAQIAGFLTVLRAKGETVAELTGCARAMMNHCTKLTVDKPAVDTCGTGGDGGNTYNISTTAAFIVAGCGIKVAKHGNRAVSSSCGSADVLGQLCIDPDPGTEAVQSCIDSIGLGFMYAPRFHSAMRHVAPVRKQLGFRTIFNIAGPLTNPAGVSVQVIGVYSPQLVEIVAQVARELGRDRAFVVHGAGGLDEVSLAGPTMVAEVEGQSVKVRMITPADLGLPQYELTAFSPPRAGSNAEVLLSVLSGDKGPHRDIAVANAAVAVYATGHGQTLTEAVALCEHSLDSGAARQKLTMLQQDIPLRRDSECLNA